VPHHDSDVYIEGIIIRGIITADGTVLGPLYRDLSVVQLLPANVALSAEKVLDGCGVCIQLFIDGGVLPNDIESLSKELGKMWVDVMLHVQLVDVCEELEELGIVCGVLALKEMPKCFQVLLAVWAVGSGGIVGCMAGSPKR